MTRPTRADPAGTVERGSDASRAPSRFAAMLRYFWIYLAPRMIREATLSPLEIADELRPAILRLARNLRRETEALGVTSHQATLLWSVRTRPGLSLRELAEEEGISAPSLSGHVDRLEAAGLLRRVRSSDDRRRVGLELTPEGRAIAQARPRPSDDVARRSARPPLGRRARARRAGATGAAHGCWSRAREAPLDRAPAPDVSLAAPPPQLPALLQRADRLGRGHVDAEHRARLARDRALGVAARGRGARVLPVRPVPRASASSQA